MTARLEDCIAGLLSFVLAAGTIHLMSDGRDVAAVWPANAVLLAALLGRRPGTGTGVFVAGFLANLAANTAMRGPSLASLSRSAEALREREAVLARLAATDPLTGALNRAAFRDAAAAAMQDPTRAPLSLIALDLDLFKQVNDRHGHAAGDRALVHLVAVLRAGLREHDAIGRVGGDEFLILLPGLGLDRAGAIAARLQEALRRKPLTLDDGTVPPLAMSCGVALHRPRTSFEDCTHEADMALYAAKRTRREAVHPA